MPFRVHLLLQTAAVAQLAVRARRPFCAAGHLLTTPVWRGRIATFHSAMALLAVPLTPHVGDHIVPKCERVAAAASEVADVGTPTVLTCAAATQRQQSAHFNRLRILRTRPASHPMRFAGPQVQCEAALLLGWLIIGWLLPALLLLPKAQQAQREQAAPSSNKLVEAASSVGACVEAALQFLAGRSAPAGPVPARQRHAVRGDGSGVPIWLRWYAIGIIAWVVCCVASDLLAQR